jgi:ATP-dependent exoDNAse (exonuclease V) beta subunit
MHPVLSKENKHTRDENISFQEEGHKYTIHTDPNSKYTSVTTWNHSHFPHFNADEVIKNMMRGKNWNPANKYWGMTSQQIKKQWSDNGENVSGAGTAMHYDIECFMNNPSLPYPYSHERLLEYYLKNELKEDPTKEWEYFLNFLKDYPDLKPYRTEWMIYHEELKLSGSIDMVYENPDGTLMIYDWKRSKDISRINNYNKFATTFCISHLPHSNFWHYALQLNTYKMILEQKYDKKITDLYLVRLHPDAEEKNYELLKVPDMSNYVEELFELRKKELFSETV